MLPPTFNSEASNAQLEVVIALERAIKAGWMKKLLSHIFG